MPRSKKASSNKAGVSEVTTSKVPSCLPPIEDVFDAMESLYTDQLRPYSRILRKRLMEQAEARHLAGNDCDADGLRALCEAQNDLLVVPEVGGEWAVILRDRPEMFIDIYDRHDPYPEDLWTAAGEYFEHLGSGDIASLPGGRYASALALFQRKLSFLKDYTLGQVCHITELAISQRKLLGYANGAIVAYERSTSRQKKICASEQRAIEAADAEGNPYEVVDWETARLKLKELLVSTQERGASSVPISNVKRLFRSLYHMELSETTLGYAKLTELLQDEKFQDICKVQLQDRGYVIVPVETPNPVVSQCEPLCFEGVDNVAYACATPSPSPQYPRIGLKPRVQSLAAQNLSLCSLLGLDAVKPSAAVPCQASDRKPDRVRFCLGSPLDVDNAHEETADLSMPTPSPTPQYSARGQSLNPVWEETSQLHAVFAAFEPAGFDPVEDSRSRTGFCADEPLSLEDSDFAGTLAKSFATQFESPSPLVHEMHPPTPSPYPQYSRSGITLHHVSQGCH